MQEEELDRVSPEVRSHIMASVGSKHTNAEIAVRRIVHAMGYRYALHRSDLPGKPDLVFPARRKIVFVHGCFWHGHRCRAGRLPKSRIQYWSAKVELNKLRDRRQRRKLWRLGWRTMVVWQCQLKNPEVLTRRLDSFLRDDDE